MGDLWTRLLTILSSSINECSAYSARQSCSPSLMRYFVYAVAVHRPLSGSIICWDSDPQPFFELPHQRFACLP